MQMKLLILTKDFSNVPGGVSDYCKNLSDGLSKLGVNVYVITSKNKKVINDYDGIKIFPIIDKWDFSCIKVILNKIEEIKPDVFSLQFVSYAYNYHGIPLWIPLLLFLLRIKKILTITTFHEVAIVFSKNPKYWLIAIIQRIINLFICIFSQKIIVSISYWRSMLSLFKSKIEIIPIGSNFLPVSMSEDERSSLRNLIAPNNEFIISTIGFNDSYKNDSLILKAINNINLTSERKVKFLIIGGLGNNNCIKDRNLIRDIYFTEFLDHENAYKHLSVSDLFIMLSTDVRGGISLKSGSIASAYCAGLPIISTSGKLTDPCFKHLGNVYFIEAMNEKEIKNAILALIKNDSLRVNLSKGAKIFYKNNLDWEIISKKFKEICESAKNN